MKELLRRSFQQGTQISRFNVLAGAIVGAPAHFLFFLIFKYGFDLPENVYVRMIATALCIAVLFIDRFPRVLRNHITVFWHGFLIFVLPFTFTYNALLTNFHELWRYWEIFMVFVLILYVPNLIAYLIDLLIGIAAAAAFFWFTAPNVDLVVDFNVPLYTIVLVFTTFAGYMFSHNNLQGALAQEKNHALRALAGSIAHEMRNPLGQVKHSLDTIGHRLPGPSVDGSGGALLDKRDLDDLYRLVAHGQMAVTRGVQVIDMILNEVRDRPIDASQFAFLSATRITLKALDEYGYDADTDRSRVHFESRNDFLFRGDETMFIFVLFNLLKNALYYLRSHPELHIHITLETGPEGNRLRFRDTGPGIDEKEIPHLFDGFYTYGKKGGTGLGLAYCKRVMLGFGGDITCESVKEEFTEFVMHFPAVPAGAMETELAVLIAEARPTLAGKRVLVVDDDALQREIVRLHLAPLDLAIDTAEDGEVAVQRCAQGAYDLILMDLNMPRMDGYQASRTILAAAGDAAPRVIAHTSEPAYIARSKVEKAGMIALLSKPCGQIELIRALSAGLLAPPPAGAAHLFTGADLDTCTLLLVDDSATLRETLAMRYEMEGCDVFQAANGNEALVLLETVQCDVVVTDISMPGMDGYQLAKRIRDSDDPEIARLPIIGVSGHSDETYSALAADAGMDAYLAKTVDFELMLAAIQDLLRRRRATAVAIPPTPPPGIDIPAVAAALGLEVAMLRERLVTFRNEFEGCPERLHGALAAGEHRTLRDLAHRIKGVGRMLRADAVARAAEQLEAVALGGPDTALAAAVETLATQLAALLDALTEELD